MDPAHLMSLLQRANEIARVHKDPLLVSSLPLLANILAKSLLDPAYEPTELEAAALSNLHACDAAWRLLYFRA